MVMKKSDRWILCVLAVAAVVLSVPSLVAEPAGSWLQWGGPTRDFQAPAAELADSWPDEGPKKLWSRALGEGYSAVLAEGDRLYTMYRTEGKEAVIAIDAKNGKTVWEHSYDSSPTEGHVTQFGEGPRATPLIVGDRIYTIGISGVMHSLNKKDGTVAWKHDLWKDFGGSFLNHGYSSSPIEYGDTVIALVGGEGASLMAFNKSDGSVAWKSLSFKNSYSAPQILEVDGQEQLITYMADELIGVNPANGELLWSYPISNQWKQNISMPILVGGKHLFLSSLQAGSRGLELSVKDGKTTVTEAWTTRKIQFYHVTAVREGDWVYGITGGRAPHFMSAINAKTGEIAWRERGFAKANCIAADGKVVALDEDGMLILATATPEKLTVHSEAQILDKVAWTAPTLVGTTMYVRDQKNLMALDLG